MKKYHKPFLFTIAFAVLMALVAFVFLSGCCNNEKVFTNTRTQLQNMYPNTQILEVKQGDYIKFLVIDIANHRYIYYGASNLGFLSSPTYFNQKTK